MKRSERLKLGGTVQGKMQNASRQAKASHTTLRDPLSNICSISALYGGTFGRSLMYSKICNLFHCVHRRLLAFWEFPSRFRLTDIYFIHVKELIDSLLATRPLGSQVATLEGKASKTACNEYLSLAGLPVYLKLGPYTPRILALRQPTPGLVMVSQ